VVVILLVVWKDGAWGVKNRLNGPKKHRLSGAGSLAESSCLRYVYEYVCEYSKLASYLDLRIRFRNAIPAREDQVP
jgi:hypothetical protein